MSWSHRRTVHPARKGAWPLVAFLLSAALALAGACLTTPALAVEGANGIVYLTPEPGTRVNISSASGATVFLVDSPGEYEFVGESDQATIRVSASGNVTLRINATIRPGERAAGGEATPAIAVFDEKGSVVTVDSSDATLSGYKSAPAIAKTGTLTKLVLKNSKINATGSGDAPAIGAAGTQSAANLTGNIEVSGGSISATSQSGVAIGGSSLDGLIISKASISTQGRLGGTESTKNVTIKSGDVTAGNIGGGDTSMITISGGTVTTTGVLGAGIGCTEDSVASQITIRGGTVNATGGTEAAGIGGALRSHVTDVTISGGYVKATGGAGGPGVGVGGYGTMDALSISGAYLVATSGDPRNTAAIGAGGGGRLMDVIIDSGIVEGSVAVYGSITNQSGEPLRRTYVEFDGMSKGDVPTGVVAEIDYLGVQRKVGNEWRDYWCVDYYSRHVPATDPIPLWVPEGCSLSAGSRVVLHDAEGDGGWDEAFFGGIVGNSLGPTTLKSATKIQVFGTGRALLNSCIAPGTARAVAFETVADDEGNKATGYYLWNNETKKSTLVFDGSGNLIASDENPFLDENGTLADGVPVISVYPTWGETTFTIYFDANYLSDASTLDLASGSMEPLTTNNMDAPWLPFNEFSLPGYEFVCWSTDPDGKSGHNYSNGGNELRADPKGGEITLYAQWRPKTYEVAFNAGYLDVGTDFTRSAVFDETFTLDECPFAREGCFYAGWKCQETGTLYDAGTSVENLCTFDEDGNPRGMQFFARWVRESPQAVVMVTEDDVPASSFADSIALVAPDGERVACDAATSDPERGTYSFEVSDGVEYRIEIPGSDVGDRTITGGGFEFLGFHSVTMTAREGISDAWLIDPVTGERTSSLSRVLDGTKVDVASSVEDGFAFKGYVAVGVEPEWGEGGPEAAEQTISVAGHTELRAFAEPVDQGVEGPAEQDDCSLARFPDVDPGAWYHFALEWAVDGGLLSGYGDTGLLGPDDSVTRAQVAQILWNLEGEPKTYGDAPYSDVAGDEWFVQAAAWCAERGIMTGYDDGTGRFGPDDPITREQLSAVLMRWAAQTGLDVSESADLDAFPDGASASPWARECLSWAVGSGVIRGAETGSGAPLLDPQGTASRAQLATMLQRIFG